MPVNPREQTAQSAVFELRGGSITLPVLKLLSPDMDKVAHLLRLKIHQAPDFFHNAPVVIDLHEMATSDGLDFFALLTLLRSLALVPVGIRGGNEAHHRAAQALNLAVLADPKNDAAKTAPHDPAKPPVSSRLVTHPVRSGQRIYAAGADLIVLSQVSPGAEIMADGNIHVYGTLRGRALAGVKGDQQSRIFCMDLQAELISIAGHYRISESLDDSARGKPVQVFFLNNALMIEDLFIPATHSHHGRI
jgi:septum site-determining protein MinC